MLFGGHIPQLLQADAVVLGIRFAVERETRDQLLAQVATAALGEQGVLAAQLHARHVAILLAAIGGHAHVTDHDAAHRAIFTMQHFLGGEAREDLDAQLLGLLAQPARQVAGADDVIAVVVHGPGDQCIGDDLRFLVILEQHDLVTGDGRLERCAAFGPVGEQLGQCTRFEHGAGQDVRADFRTFLDHADRQLLLGRVGLLHQSAGRRQAGRAGTDDDHVEIHEFAFHDPSPQSLRRQGPADPAGRACHERPWPSAGQWTSGVACVRARLAGVKIGVRLTLVRHVLHGRSAARHKALARSSRIACRNSSI